MRAVDSDLLALPDIREQDEAFSCLFRHTKREAAMAMRAVRRHLAMAADQGEILKGRQDLVPGFIVRFPYSVIEEWDLVEKAEFGTPVTVGDLRKMSFDSAQLCYLKTGNDLQGLPGMTGWMHDRHRYLSKITIAFGKHKGSALPDIPLSYLDSTISVMPPDWFVRRVIEFVDLAMNWKEFTHVPSLSLNELWAASPD